MRGEEIIITKAHHMWTDNGNKMFYVHYTRPDGSEWVMRHWARDELDAYMIAKTKLEGAT